MKERIFIAEDDSDIAELLQFNLQKKDYQVTLETDGEKAFDLILKDPPDLLILDLNLPGLSGIEICKYLRENQRTKDLPIIMLTARTQEIDKVIGFELGADDYVTKPFSVRELLARIQALLRRAKPSRADVYEIDSLKIYLNRQMVTCDNQEISLTPTEYKILEALLIAKGRVINRDDLLEKIRGTDYIVESRTIDVHIKRLRDKLGSCAYLIETIKGTGYRFKIND